MVFINSVLCFAKKVKRVSKRTKGSFIDSLRIYCAGGSGGNGLPNFGGIGGQGGCIYCVGTENMNLNKISKMFPDKRLIAKHGEDSFKRKIIGSPGEDIALNVPLGLTVYSEKVKLGEINEVGETCILARGGPGGTKENGFIGREGQKRTVVLDLKLIADVGFVGFPNAGKSTLLKALSRAKPQIADYPFTTIRPNLGTIVYPDFRQISLADLPGLIEGAHINIGMGHRFLKHVERTKLLLLVADIQGFRLTPKHHLRTCFETVLLLNKELELYNPDLIDKPSMLLLNKMDTENSKEKFDEVNHKLKHIEDYLHEVPPEIRPDKQLHFSEIMGISAKEGKEDIVLVKNTIRALLDLTEEEQNHDDVIDQIENNIRERGPMIT